MNSVQRTIINVSRLQMFLKTKLLCKKLTNDDILYMKMCAHELIKLTKEDAKAYVFLGKINLLEHDYEEAQIAFDTAKDFNPTLGSSYYGLFKINIINKNYEEALKNINLYQKCSKVDCSLYTSLLENILYNKEIKLDNCTNLFGVKFNFKPLLHNYKLFIDCINNKEYNQSLKHLYVCIKLIKKEGYHLDLSYLCILVEKVRNDYNEKVKIKEIDELKNLVFTSNNFGYIYLILIKLYNLEPNNIDNLILLIEILLMYENYEQAEFFLREGLKKEPQNPRLLNFYYIIKEYDSNDNKLLAYTKIDININNLLMLNQYQSAVENLVEQFNITHDSYFLYRMGVIFFEQGQLIEAKDVFIKYLNSGKHKYQKIIYYYLFYICYYLNDDSYYDYASKALELTKFSKSEISLEEFMEKLLQTYNFDSSCIITIEKNLLTNYSMNPNKMKIKVQQKSE